MYVWLDQLTLLFYFLALWVCQMTAIFKVVVEKQIPTIPDHLSDDGKNFIKQCLQ
ncbi:putative mitogen-activated protein kinase kinase kinase [Helianthus anomalus]